MNLSHLPRGQRTPEIVTAATSSNSNGLPTTNIPSPPQNDVLSIDVKNNASVEPDQDENAGRRNVAATQGKKTTKFWTHFQTPKNTPPNGFNTTMMIR